MKYLAKLSLFAMLVVALLPSQALAAPGDITRFAGDGTFAQSGAAVGDGAAATAAPIVPRGNVAFDSAGNVFIAEVWGRVRMVDAVTGFISTVAGIGSQVYLGDGGLATLAGIGAPVGIAIDAADNIYIADAAKHVIRKFTVGGNISTVAGIAAIAGSVDGAVGVSTLNSPHGMAVQGNVLYIADTSNHKIRALDLTTSTLSTVAGVGTGNFSGDGAAATLAELNSPLSVAVNATDFYIADKANNRIRKVNIGTGIITTFAGTGVVGPIGDFGSATSASVVAPEGVALDASGDLYIANTSWDRIQVVSVTSGNIATIAGDGIALNTGDNGPASAAQVRNPEGVAVDASGNIYITSQLDNIIRKITPDTIAPTATVVSVDGGNLTNTTAVTLTLGCYDGANAAANIPCSYMQFSNDAGATWSTLTAYASPANWTITAGDGAKTIDARFTDVAGNISNVVQGTVTLDQTGPAAPVFLQPLADTITQSTAIPAISGTAEVGATINVKDGGVSLSLVTATGGNWANNATAGTLSEGVHTFSAIPTDLAGNVGTTASVTYTIDNTPPVITLNGSNPVTVNQGTAYVDEGATALDAVYGDVSGNISHITPTTGAYPGGSASVGQYAIAYTASDPLGNQATGVVRFINVVDNGSGGGGGGGCTINTGAAFDPLMALMLLLAAGLLLRRRRN